MAVKLFRKTMASIHKAKKKTNSIDSFASAYTKRLFILTLFVKVLAIYSKTNCDYSKRH